MGRRLDRLKCVLALGGHQYAMDRAIDRQDGGATLVKTDSEDEEIDACTIVEVCRRCGDERDVAAAVTTAERFDVIDCEWNDE